MNAGNAVRSLTGEASAAPRRPSGDYRDASPDPGGDREEESGREHAPVHRPPALGEVALGRRQVGRPRLGDGVGGTAADAAT
ncbi:hypothetical protein BRD03_11630 [Halobacteriales archaeon QS_9_68_17]|nr:MAG: hypothetical protein BRD03_11630 [Halobacteriales archaeon QS_9_68_17]